MSACVRVCSGDRQAEGARKERAPAPYAKSRAAKAEGAGPCQARANKDDTKRRARERVESVGLRSGTGGAGTERGAAMSPFPQRRRQPGRSDAEGASSRDEHET